MTKSNVVVVGGGRAGIEIAKQLSQKLDASKYELIMITSRPFSIWLPPLVRAVVTSEGNLESLETGSLVPYGVSMSEIRPRYELIDMVVFGTLQINFSLQERVQSGLELWYTSRLRQGMKTTNAAV
jgi:hypothetical protein